METGTKVGIALAAVAAAIGIGVVTSGKKKKPKTVTTKPIVKTNVITQTKKPDYETFVSDSKDLVDKVKYLFKNKKKKKEENQEKIDDYIKTNMQNRTELTPLSGRLILQNESEKEL